MNKQIILISGAVALVVALGVYISTRPNNDTSVSAEVNPSPTSTASVHSLTPAATQTLISQRAADPSFVIMDVRTASEFASGHLAGAKNLVDYYAPDMQSQVSALDHTKTYVVYCRTGHRSGEVTRLMSSLGFGNVYDLSGGITAWQAAGQTIE